MSEPTQSSAPSHPSSHPPDPVVEAAAKGRFVGAAEEVRGKARKRISPERIRAPPPPTAGAYSIAQFCLCHGGMSEAFFYKLQAAGLGPKTMKVGARTMISIEAAAKWRAEREAAQ